MTDKNKKPHTRRRPTQGGEDHHVYFDAWSERKVHEFLTNNSNGRGSMNRSELVRIALQRFFKEEERYWPLAFLRLDRLTAAVGAYTKRLHLLINVVMHGQAYNFLNWPDLSPEEKVDA